MSKKMISVEVEPSILNWAIDTSGWNINELVEKTKINHKTLNGWLKGESKPTLKELEKLAKTIKRPLAAFLLSEPPKEPKQPPDYRMIPGKEGEFDKDTILAIRKGRRLQRISKELIENLESNINTDISQYKLSDNPREVGERFRNKFQIDEKIKKKWSDSYKVFKALRELIEEMNIIVFQMPMPQKDASGFTLIDKKPPVIVVNSKDQIERRIFTLMHEFGHVLIGESGVSIPDNALYVKNPNKIERWCNEFASAFLLPEKMAKEIFDKHRSNFLESPTLNGLSRKFKVSKAMLLFSMVKLNLITRSQYNSVLNRFKPELEVKGKDEEGVLIQELLMRGVLRKRVNDL